MKERRGEGRREGEERRRGGKVKYELEGRVGRR